MRRRHFITLGGVAFGALLLPTRAPAADLAPIGIADFGRGDQRQVIRIYPDGRAGTYLLHIRAERRNFTQRIQLSGDPEGTMRGLVQDGRAQMRLADREVTISAPNAARGVFEVDGVGQINIVTDPVETAMSGPATGITISLLTAVFAWGVALGAGAAGGGSTTTTTTSSGGSTQTTTEEAEEEDEGDGIIASQECDGPPIRLC